MGAGSPCIISKRFLASYRDPLPQFSTNKHGVGNGIRGKMEMATVGYPLMIGADAQGKYFPLASMLLSVKVNCKLARRSHGKPHPIPVVCCEVKTWAAARTSRTGMDWDGSGNKCLPCMGEDLSLDPQKPCGKCSFVGTNL